jgi:hypothetical protein
MKRTLFILSLCFGLYGFTNGDLIATGGRILELNVPALVTNATTNKEAYFQIEMTNEIYKDNHNLVFDLDEKDSDCDPDIFIAMVRHSLND